MRGLGGINVPTRLGNGPAQLTDGLVGFNRRVSGVYVYQQPHRALQNQNSNIPSMHPNGHTGSNVSGATSVVENGRYGACGGRFDQPQPPLSPTTAATNMAAYLPADKVEKIPLVQQWSPSSGVRSSVTRIGKSMSLDTPVSIAHV